MTTRALTWIGVVALSLGGLEHAAAQAARATDAAYASYLEADFEAAAEHASRAVADGTTSRSDLARAHALLAVLASVESDRPLAERQARFAVAIEPTVAIPEGAPRWLTEQFETARVEGASAHLAIANVGDRAIARLEGAPEGLATVSIACGPAAAEGRREAAVEHGGHACEARATTAGGQVLWTASWAQGASAPAVLAPDPRTTEGGSDDTPWIVLGVVAGAAVIAGIVIGVVVASTPGDVRLGAPTVLQW